VSGADCQAHQLPSRWRSARTPCGAATTKLLGTGLNDADFVEKVSRLVVEHDVSAVSNSKSKDGRSQDAGFW
jgi:hypothetical protein